MYTVSQARGVLGWGSIHSTPHLQLVMRGDIYVAYFQLILNILSLSFDALILWAVRRQVTSVDHPECEVELGCMVV